jgi:osmoprotectant transport system substrate-binding protein
MLALAALIGVGCGASPESSAPADDDAPAPTNVEPLSNIDLDGTRIRVGSKDFTEQLVLGHIAHQALLAAGARAEADIGSVGTAAAREALRSGETDLYWEYTGTSWIEFLGHARPIPDAREQYDAVAREDQRRNGITWLTPAEFDNTYALAVRPDAAERLDVDSISDLERLIDEQPADATVCVESEFATRRDGLPGLEAHYGFAFPRANVRNLDTGVIYGAIDRGDPCTFGEVFRTDARIGALDLVVLDDDEDFFPIYQPAVTIRSDVLERSPEIADVFRRVAPLLDEATMIELNRTVDVEGQLPRQVAIDWLRDTGLID